MADAVIVIVQAVPEGTQVNLTCSLLVAPGSPAIPFSVLVDYSATPSVINAAIKSAAVAAASAQGKTVGDLDAVTITGGAAGL